MMDPDVIEDHDGLGAGTLSLEILNEGREGAHVVAACEMSIEMRPCLRLSPPITEIV